MSTFNGIIFNKEAFGKYLERIPRTRQNALLKGGVLKKDANIHNALSTQTGTNYATIPMLGKIGGKAVNYDGATTITTNTTKTYSRGVVVVGRANAWTERDFSYDITGGEDFMHNVATQVSSYWEDVYNDILLSVLKGIFEMKNGENKKFVDAHTHDITKVENGLINATTLNTATQKACGDNKSKINAVFLHSVVATNLENLKLLKYLTYTDAEGVSRDLTLATWNGKTVFIDDSLPVLEKQGSGSNETHYISYALGAGAIDFEDLGAKVEQEVTRNALTNGGETTLVSRRRLCYAPYGISYKDNSKISPLDADLEKGENWELVKSNDASEVIDHKAIPILRIISKG